MSCYYPIPAWQAYPGAKPKLHYKPRFTEGGTHIQLNCGRCLGCKQSKALGWSLRCEAELRRYTWSIYATFTYDEEHCPPDMNLDYSHFQGLMHRTRKYKVRELAPDIGGILVDKRIPFIVCGEYGDLKARPHFHAILFDFCPHDAKQACVRGDFPIYKSKILTDLWGKGIVEFSMATTATAKYIAQYTMKKIYGKEARSAYEVLNPDTGEIIDRIPEFIHSSKRPALGLTYIEKDSSLDNVYGPFSNPKQRGISQITAREKPSRFLPPPKYYDVILKRKRPKQYEAIKADRILAMDKAISEPDYASQLRLKEITAYNRLAFHNPTRLHYRATELALSSIHHDLSMRDVFRERAKLKLLESKP